MNTANRIAYKTAVLAGLIIGAFTLSAAADWTAPLDVPPSCTSGNPGCDAPLTVGNTMQTKVGALTLNTSGSPFQYGLIVANGTVGIRTASPDTSTALDVESAPIKAGGGLILETRASDPTNPATGRIWLITP